jgi:hypothetical protein
MTAERRRYQREVERLLAQIGDRMRELQVMKVRGARGAALRDTKEAVKQARLELAQLLR